MNKKIIKSILVFIFTVFALFVVMSTVSAKSMHEQCVGIRGLAFNIMDARQAGLGVVKAMEIAESAESKAAAEAVKKIVFDAYQRPTYSSAKYKRKSANDFGDRYYMICMGYGK